MLATIMMASFHAYLPFPDCRLFLIDRAVDAFLIADLSLNFFTGTVGRTGRVTLQREAVVLEYVTGWFALDLVSSVPYELILMMAYPEQVLGWSRPVLAGAATLGQVFKLIKLTRLVRLF